MNDAINASPVSLDLPTLLRKFDNNFEFFRTVAEVYLSDVPNHIRTIQACIERADCPGLEAAAHQLKGAAANFSSALVVKVAAQIENLARSNNIDLATACVTKLIIESEQLNGEIFRHIDQGQVA